MSQKISYLKKSITSDCCCSCGCLPFSRRFLTDEEKQESLEEYQNQLKRELAGIEEHIQKLERN
jgi:hypothetical protein